MPRQRHADLLSIPLSFMADLVSRHHMVEMIFVPRPAAQSLLVGLIQQAFRFGLCTGGCGTGLIHTDLALQEEGKSHVPVRAQFSGGSSGCCAVPACTSASARPDAR